jgi:hypothetical protein
MARRTAKGRKRRINSCAPGSSQTPTDRGGWYVASIWQDEGGIADVTCFRRVSLSLPKCSQSWRSSWPEKINSERWPTQTSPISSSERLRTSLFGQPLFWIRRYQGGTSSEFKVSSCPSGIWSTFQLLGRKGEGRCTRYLVFPRTSNTSGKSVFRFR